MSSVVDRYDSGAADYARYWGPVLEKTSIRLFDEIDEHFRTDRLVLLDVGAGIGTLAMDALERWPHAEVIASDAAAGMLEHARERALGRGIDLERRLSFVVGPAEELPLGNGAVDAAISSFVLQLVPDRLAALAEIRRVVRPGGMFAYVTWLDREAREPFRAADEFDEAVYDLEVEEPEEAEEGIAGDVPSAGEAAQELEQAGFVGVAAHEETLVYEWTMEGYLDYKLGYDELALLSVLDEQQQRQLELNARERLSKLKPADFRWHAPVVFARGFVPPSP
jgi:ubiquinone/menaquinone biosynthesis C-methylase UbiE